MSQFHLLPIHDRADDVADELADHPATEPISLTYRVITLLAILIPFVGLVVAIALLWGPGFGWVHFGVFFSMYVLTGLGITIGYHRLFTHRAFETNPVLKFIFAVLGSMAVEGPLLTWVATHRMHHQHSDRDHDPHSPHGHGVGIRAFFRGLWEAHMGWLLRPHAPGLKRYIADFDRDRVVRFVSQTFPLWVLLGMLIPTLIAGLVTMSWTGALLGLLWGGLVRIFLVHHVTWSINSVCHIWGTQPFRSHDHSRNNPVFGVLAFGEGWHNNHHAFPTSARHGLRWWEFDISYIIIRCLEILRLAWNVKVPTPDRLAAKLVVPEKVRRSTEPRTEQDRARVV